MRVLIDTNLLLRAQHHGHPHRLPAREAMARLIAAGYELCVFAQNAIEFWVVATRPVSVNGLGWSAQQAAASLNRALQGLSVYADPPDLLARWQQLVTQYGIIGARAHDVRLVAGMEAHGITYIFTFNAADFNWHPGITCLDPLVIGV